MFKVCYDTLFHAVRAEQNIRYARGRAHLCLSTHNPGMGEGRIEGGVNCMLINWHCNQARPYFSTCITKWLVVASYPWEGNGKHFTRASTEVLHTLLLYWKSIWHVQVAAWINLVWLAYFPQTKRRQILLRMERMNARKGTHSVRVTGFKSINYDDDPSSHQKKCNPHYCNYYNTVWYVQGCALLSNVCLTTWRIARL